MKWNCELLSRKNGDPFNSVASVIVKMWLGIAVVKEWQGNVMLRGWPGNRVVRG